MTPPLIDRIQQLADDVSAPPTVAARTAVAARTRHLRRRHRAAVAAGGAALAACALAAVVVLTPGDEGATDVTDPVVTTLPDRGATVAYTAEADGWSVTGGDEYVLSSEDVLSGALTPGTQVFGVPDDPAGPVVVVTRTVASDAVVPRDAASAVVVADGPGELVEPAPGAVRLQWSSGGDAQSVALAWGLTRDEVVSFAEGLRPAQVDASYPDDGGELGYDEATVRPGGIEEITPAVVEPTLPTGRRMAFASGAATAEVTVAPVAPTALDAFLAEAINAEIPVEAVEVDGRPALLTQLAADLWSIGWAVGDGTAAHVTVTGADRTAVDALLAGLRPVGEQGWEEMARPETMGDADSVVDPPPDATADATAG